jgi:hypothetical protein
MITVGLVTAKKPSIHGNMLINVLMSIRQIDISEILDEAGMNIPL